MGNTDYYKVLGIDVQADVRTIKEAYRHRAFQYHPDRNRDNPAAAEQMKVLNEAYAVLSDPAKRRRYDALRRQYGSTAYSRFRKSYSEQDIFSGSDIQHVFEEMAKSFGFRGFDDIFKEFYGHDHQPFGARRPGFFAGGFIFSGPFAGKPRQPSPGSHRHLGRFSRYLLEKVSGVRIPQRGADVQDVIHISMQHARQGGAYAYFVRKRGKKLVVQIPAGIRDGQQIRLAGMGAAGRGQGPPGDLYLKVKIRKPLLSKLKGYLTGNS